MALAKAVAVDRVRYLGHTEPYDYEAGVMGRTSFPAGTSLKVCVGTEVHGFEVLKVKTDEVFDVLKVIAALAINTPLEIEYQPGGAGQAPRLLSVKVVGASVPAAPQPVKVS